ncbi:MAG: DUF1273 family protein [Clostridia bacterium]|nr:DUF1273 family protein [Clostridia bacterium]
MEQLRIKTEEKREIKSCVFTGHRELGEDFSPKKLYEETEKLIKRGVDTFYSGMAMGFDIMAAFAVLFLKKKYPHVKLVACIPCYGQEKNFPTETQAHYAEILKKADEKVLLSEHYYQGCMQVRDKYMVDNSDVMIAYCKKSKGGAAYTVGYFKKKYPDGEIVFV